MPPFAVPDDQLAIIQQRYLSGETLTRIADNLKVSRYAVKTAIRRTGSTIRPFGYWLRKYDCDYSFFDSIESELQAYWLGFIAADGCVSMQNGHGVFTIELATVDHDHLQRLRDVLRSNNPIKERPAHQYGKYLTHGSFVFRIFSDQLTRALISHGVTERKSHTIQWPTGLATELFHHYLRGYVDGDGCFSGSGRQAICAITSSLPFLKGCQLYLAETLGFAPTKLRLTSQSALYGVLTVGGKRQFARLFDHLYHDALIYLPRKHIRAERLLPLP